MIGAVLCDFDGVVRLWPERDVAHIEAEFGLPAGALDRAAFEPKLLRQATTGAISDEEWRARVAVRLAHDHGESARAAVPAWSRLVGTIDARYSSCCTRCAGWCRSCC